MNLGGNTILITGGASGIGLAFAERFLQAGSKVIICGRRADKLDEVKEKHPDIVTRMCDVSKESDRINLTEWVQNEYPDLNILLNNAGIQQREPLIQKNEPWSYHQQEIAINLEAPIHLALLFLPLLKSQPLSYIINVTSGLAFAPLANAAIYSATKAALHSFTLSLRHQLTGTPVQVLEIVPPAVQTDLGGTGVHTFGAPLKDFADTIMLGLETGEQEIGYGTSNLNRKASRTELNDIFNQMNASR